MKTGLVLEGGSMRGLFTAGILDVMMENGLLPDAVVGVSAGACFGCNIKSGQIGRAIRYNKRFAKDWRYCSIRSLLITGDLFGAEYSYHTLPGKLDVFDQEAYMASPIEFRAVATDTQTGKPVYRQLFRGDDGDLEWLRASASVPLVSRPVPLEGRTYLDGGLADSIPLAYHLSIGILRNIVVLTRPADYVKQPQKLMPLMRIALRKHPGAIHALQTRHETYAAARRLVFEQEALRNALVLMPPAPLPAHEIEHDPDKLQQTYDMGRREALKHLEELKAFLQESREMNDR